MPVTRHHAAPRGADWKPFDFWDRLKEIDRFFQNDAPVHHTMRRTAKRLQDAGIPYALTGGMAVNAHGAQRTTDSVDFLLTEPGLERFRRELAGPFYDQVSGRSRRFIDRENGVTVDILVTGRSVGRKTPGPITFPDSANVSQLIDAVNVVTLPQLVQLNLADGRYYALGDVAFLISVHNLDESFAEQLHPYVRPGYLACLEEKRRGDEYES